jgi:hypothetical protein
MGERLEEAKLFLSNVLAEGPVDSEVVRKKAAEAGITEKTLKRAKAAIGVGSSRAGSWCSLWSLPAEQAAPSEAKPDGAPQANLPATSRGIAWLRENPEAVAEAVRENRGLLTHAARQLGVHRNSLARLRDEDEGVRNLVTEAQESLMDELEDTAFSRALRGGGNQQLLMFLLKTKAKERGYVEAAREREVTSHKVVRIIVHAPWQSPASGELWNDSFPEEIMDAEEVPAHGRQYSLSLTLPPLATMVLKPVSKS